MSPLALALCVPLTIAAVGCLLVLLDPGVDLAIRPLPPEDWPATACIKPVSGVPVSPTLHQLYDGRVPKPVIGRATVAVRIPRHGAPLPVLVGTGAYRPTTRNLVRSTS